MSLRPAVMAINPGDGIITAAELLDQSRDEVATRTPVTPVCQPDPIHSPFGINYISGPQILDSQHAKINIRAARHTGYT